MRRARQPRREAKQNRRAQLRRAPARPRHEFDERQPDSNQSTILIEGGDDFDEEEGEEFDEENEPNFNRVEGAPVAVGAPQAAGGAACWASSGRATIAGGAASAEGAAREAVRTRGSQDTH